MRKFIIIIAALALGLAACSSEAPVEEHHDDHADVVTTREVHVDLNEFNIVLDGTVEYGETVTFVVTNVGIVPHEFEVTGEHAIKEHLEGGHDGHMEMSMNKLVLDPSETGSLTVTIDGDMDIAA